MANRTSFRIVAEQFFIQGNNLPAELVPVEIREVRYDDVDAPGARSLFPQPLVLHLLQGQHAGVF